MRESSINYYMLPEHDERRIAYLQGCTDEAHHRDAPYEKLGRDVHQMTEYVGAIVEHESRQARSTGALLASLAFVFRSTMTKNEITKIQRALEGVMP